MIVMDPKATTKSHVYQAPVLYLAIFYVLLAAWAIVCYTCYFSVAISYKIEVWDDGDIRLTSFRKTIDTHAEEIPIVEGPHFPVGFTRFRLEREKAYLFCLTNNEVFKKILSVIRNANPDIKFKNL